MVLYDSSKVDTNVAIREIHWDAGDNIFMKGGLEEACLAATLRDDDFTLYHNDSNNAWATDHVIDYAPIDDTDSLSYRALAVNEVAVIMTGYLQLETLSDNIHVEIGYFSDATPGVASDLATFTNLSGFDLVGISHSAASGANNMQVVSFCPPLTVAQSATAGCVGFRVKVNDTNVDACVGIRGFVIRDFDQYTST